MNPSTRACVHLAVVGAALIAVAVRPAEAASSWSGQVVATPTRSATDAPASAPEMRSATASPPRRELQRHRRSATRRAGTRQPEHRERGRSNAASHRDPVRRVSPPARHLTTGPSRWGLLNDAIARIPTYRAGAARWVVSDRYGHWGTADWYHDTLYVSPSVPIRYVYDVAVHEWSHELSVLDYGGDVSAAVTAMNHYFGGAGLVGAERAADCMAILQGATWTHYTSCTNSHWRAGAANLLKRRRL